MKTIPILYETWEVSLQLYIALFETGIKSILRLTNTDTDWGNTGDRLLAVFMDSEVQQLDIFYQVRDKSFRYKHTNQLSANTWYNLTMRQDFDRGEFIIRIFIDGDMIYEDPVYQYLATTYADVKVYAGDMHFPPSILGWMDELNVTTGRSCTYGRGLM